MSVKDVVVPVKSDSDDREYRVITLSNNIQAILVSDPETDKSAASMAVNVGSFSDPKDCLGLAHFLEHMLFLGTEKFPDEASYGAAVNKYGGSLNAWTDKEVTNYFFDVTPEYLDEILDRFSQFFIAPLFTASATDREMNAVHSEHQKNLQSDSWRSFEMLRQAMNPEHPFGRFATGDLTTLRDKPTELGLNVRDILLKFHADHYSANMMKVSIYGKEDLDTLQAYALKYFGPIADKGVAAPAFEKDIEKIIAEPRTVFEFAPVTDRRRVSMQWVLPSCVAHWDSNPLGLLSHLMGYEGPKSVLSYLKHQGWAEALMSSVDHNDTFSQFGVDVDLTEEGLSHIAEVMQAVCAYVRMVVAASDADLLRIHEELLKLDELRFRFKAKEEPFSYVSDLTCNLLKYPAKEVLRAPHISPVFRPDLVREYAQRLTADNAVIQIIAKVVNSDRRLGTFAVSEVTKEWETEQYYKIPYYKYCLTVTDLTKLKKALPEGSIGLPDPNLFIASDFNIRTSEEDQVTQHTYEGVPDNFPTEQQDDLFEASFPLDALSPVLGLTKDDLYSPKLPTDLTDKSALLDVGPTHVPVPLPEGPWLPVKAVFDGFTMVDRTQPVELWYKLDRVFNKPKGIIYAHIQSPLAYATPRVHVLTNLMVKLATESLAEELYPATNAGLDYVIDAGVSGVTVCVSGYNHKLGLLMHRIVERIRALPLVITPALFDREKDKLVRGYLDSLKAPAYAQARYNESFALATPMFHTHEKLSVLSTLTAQDLFAFINPFFASGRIIVYAHGNLVRKEAVRLSQALVALCMMKPPLVCELQAQRRAMLPPGCTVVQWPQGNPDDKESAIMALYQAGPLFPTAQSDYKSLALGSLLTQVMSDSCYDTLRTKEQLGYIVWSFGQAASEGYCHSVVVQSSQPPLYVDSRIEAFLNTTFPQILEEMDQETFEAYVEARVAQLREKERNAAQEADRHWNKLRQGTYDWARGEKIAQVMLPLTKAELIEYYNHYMLANGPGRRKFVTEVCARHLPVPENAEEYVFPAPASEDSAPAPTGLKVNLVDPRQIGAFKRSLSASPAFY